MTLEARAVSVRAGGRWLLDAVSLSLRPGELTALVGPNGAGKSTLLDVLSGHRRPESGEVLLDGRPLAAWPLHLLALQRAVLTQDSDLAFPFAVEDVVDLGQAPHRDRRGREARRRVGERAMALAQVGHLAQRLYPTLSGGERQRVMLARVLAQLLEPEGLPAGRWLLLDEPTSSLDLAHQKLVLETVAALAEDGCGAIVVLHDLNLAVRFADRVALLAEGRLIASGTPEAVLTTERVGDVYGVEVARRPGLALA